MYLITKGSLSLLLLSTIVQSFPIQDQIAAESISQSVGGTDSVALKLDSFYKAPLGFERAAPGSILNYRPVPRPIAYTDATPIRPKAAWQIQYRTQNSVGEPEASVVTVLEPFNAKPGNLFAEAFLVDSAYAGCNPSLALQQGDRPDNMPSHFQTLIIIDALSQGWYVSVADDTGPQAAYSSGLQSGYATLDSIRAVKNSGNITGISANPITTLNGYSGGAIAAAWASELQPSYAPELEIAGAAVGGLTPNHTALTENMGESSISLYLASALLGISHDFKNVSEWLSENLVPSLESEFRRAESQCLSSNTFYQQQDFGKYFKRGIKSLFDPLLVGVTNNVGTMGMRGTPAMPWYVYHSTGDEVSPIKFTDKLVEKYCSQGANIYYQRNLKNISHSSETLSGYPGAFQWLTDRQNGKDITAGCQTVSVLEDTISSDPSGILNKSFMQNAYALLGLPIGRW